MPDSWKRSRSSSTYCCSFFQFSSRCERTCDIKSSKSDCAEREETANMVATTAWSSFTMLCYGLWRFRVSRARSDERSWRLPVAIHQRCFRIAAHARAARRAHGGIISAYCAEAARISCPDREEGNEHLVYPLCHCPRDGGARIGQRARRSNPARWAGRPSEGDRILGPRRSLRRLQDGAQPSGQRALVSLHGSFFRPGMEHPRCDKPPGSEVRKIHRVRRPEGLDHVPGDRP